MIPRQRWLFAAQMSLPMYKALTVKTSGMQEPKKTPPCFFLAAMTKLVHFDFGVWMNFEVFVSSSMDIHSPFVSAQFGSICSLN